MKKTIIIFGNCQAQLMTACLHSISFFQEMDPSNTTAKKNLKFMKNEVSIFEQKS